MSSDVTKHMIPVYTQMSGQVQRFFSGFFRSPASNFYNGSKIEVDIEREDEDIAIVITDLSTGYRYNSFDDFTNKEMESGIFKEAVSLNSDDLLKREAGSNPFEDPTYRATLITRLMKRMVIIEKKIRRSIELQCSQVLQTGTITLKDENGVDKFTVDYSPKTTHFPTASVPWNNTSNVMLDDLLALCNVVRNDGLENPIETIWGETVMEVALKDTKFMARFDTRRADLGTINPMVMRGNGGNYRGALDLGNFKIDIWTYGGRYKDPETGVKTQYMDPEKVIVKGNGRLDLTFGGIPNIGRLLGAQANNLIPEMPGRVSNPEGGMDIHTNVWLTPDGEQIMAGLGSRPLPIPTAIDTFGCIDSDLE